MGNLKPVWGKTKVWGKPLSLISTVKGEKDETRNEKNISGKTLLQQRILQQRTLTEVRSSLFDACKRDLARNFSSHKETAR